MFWPELTGCTRWCAPRCRDLPRFAIAAPPRCGPSRPRDRCRSPATEPRPGAGAHASASPRPAAGGASGTRVRNARREGTVMAARERARATCSAPGMTRSPPSVRRVPNRLWSGTTSATAGRPGPDPGPRRAARRRHYPRPGPMARATRSSTRHAGRLPGRTGRLARGTARPPAAPVAKRRCHDPARAQLRHHGPVGRAHRLRSARCPGAGHAVAPPATPTPPHPRRRAQGKHGARLAACTLIAPERPARGISVTSGCRTDRCGRGS
jgi:hypothetical protein